MPNTNFTQSSFLGGEWSKFAQGRIELPAYKNALNVCRNGVPMEEGTWVRRSGTHFASITLNGAAGRVISFAFERASPYMLEFTDGFIRMYASAIQTTGLATPLPIDFRLVTTNDNQQVASINTNNPAQVGTSTFNGWVNGDQVQFLFDSTLDASVMPLLRNRTFKITTVTGLVFSIADAVTGANIDGSTIGLFLAAYVGHVIVVRNLAIVTPYTSGSWSTIRRVQAERDAVFLHGSFPPKKLTAVTLPTASAFATFSLTTPAFTDGPYLDPPTDGTVLTPSISAVTQGTLPVVGSWTGIAWSSTLGLFAAVNSNTTAAATSADGITWVARVLPTTVQWSAVAWNGTVFAAVALGTTTNAATTAVATSADGITWTLRTGISGRWSAIAWNGTVFCAVQFSSATAMTSPDGITWTSRTLPASATWTSIAWNGTVFAAIGFGPNIVATSPDGITWTQRVLPVATAWRAIAWNGTVFAAVGGFPSDIAVTSPDGITWTQRSMPSPQPWSAIAASGAGLFVAVSNSNVSATSSDGITWTIRAMPASGWDAIAWNGTVFCAIASGSDITSVTSTGSFSTVTLIASSLSSINTGSGFLSTDVGRQIRLRSEPLPWIVTTAYVAGNAVVFSGVYYKCLAGTTGDQPDISPTKWAISAAAARWTWGIIASITNPLTVVVSLSGLDLLYTTQINTWRLGAYSTTTGWPTCGTYYEGRLWLSGAIPNRVDASFVNQLFNMAPTAVDGTVADNNAISYTFNSDDVNPIFWMVGTKAGIVSGTQAGEWLISAPTTGPISPTNIQAQHGTHYGCSNIEPEPTEITISFVQRFNRKILEYFPDVFSGRYIAPNLTQHAKHLTTPGIAEIRYQQELLPVLWTRCLDGSLVGASYKRSSLFSSQPPDFIGWHRHDLGSSRVLESIAVGPSADGTLDTLAMVTNGADNIRHVEFMESVFDVDSDITAGWFCDDAIVPSGGTIVAAGVNSTLTFYGLWHLNGKTVTVWCGGIDVGDFAVSGGSVTVPIDNDVAGLFTHQYLVSISSTSAYGSKATLIDGPYGRLTVPAVVGFTYASQGQCLRPDWAEGTSGTSQAKPSRIHQLGGLLAGCQGISFGTSFDKLHSANFKTPRGTAYTNLQLFSGVYWETLDDEWSFDSMICWQITRPYPSAISSIGGFIQTTNR